jgi:hypothetical protein
VLGVVVAGDRRGQAFDVCIARDTCQVHWKKEIADRQKTAQLRTAGKTKQADEREAKAANKQRNEEAQRAAAAARWKTFYPALAKAVKAAAAALPQALPARAFGLLIKEHGLPKGTTVEDLPRALVRELVNDQFHDWASHYNEADLVSLATALGVDVKALDPKATAAAAPAKKGGKRR